MVYIWLTNIDRQMWQSIERPNILGTTVAGGSAVAWSGSFRMRYSVSVPQIALLIGQAPCADDLSEPALRLNGDRRVDQRRMAAPTLRLQAVRFYFNGIEDPARRGSGLKTLEPLHSLGLAKLVGAPVTRTKPKPDRR